MTVRSIVGPAIYKFGINNLAFTSMATSSDLTHKTGIVFTKKGLAKDQTIISIS